MVPLARRNLFTEKMRFVMSVGGVASAVLLVLVVLGLYRGWSTSSEFFGELPGDVWVAQVGTSDPLRSSSLLPATTANELEQIDGVMAVVPVYTRRVGIPVAGGELSAQVMGFVDEGLPLSPADRERFVPTAGTLNLDEVFAHDAGVGVGDAVEILGRSLTVARLAPDGNPLFALVFVNGADARDLIGVEDFVSFLVLVTRPGTDIAALTATIDSSVAGVEARTKAEYAGTMADVVDQGFLPVVGALVGIGLSIGGAVVALTTYTATVEKAREFAVLKALGASAWFVQRIVVRQSAIVGLVGTSIGVVASVLVARLVRRAVPAFLTELRWTDMAAVATATILVSLLSAYLPVRRINRIDPAMVFRA